jgi:hypothetical protein
MKERSGDAGYTSRIPFSSQSPARHASYGHSSKLGSAAIRAAAIMAVAVVMVGLLNRPNGNWAPAVNIAPTPAASASR